MMEAGREAAKRREHELRERAKRSPCVSGAGGRAASAPTTSTASSRTYAAAASCSPVTRSSSSRNGPVAFESDDLSFTLAKLADVANFAQFNFLPEDRASIRDLATEMSNALPAAVTIQEAVDVANTSRPDLRDLAGRLLAGMLKANARATAPVVYPGCSGPSSATSGGFQQPAPGRVKKTHPSRSSRESGPGSSGEESGWSSAGASRRPQEPSSSSAGGSRERKVAKRSGDGARGSKTKSGTGSGSDTSLSRKPGRQR